VPARVPVPELTRVDPLGLKYAAASSSPPFAGFGSVIGPRCTIVGAEGE
jgi:hypothetical protein